MTDLGVRILRLEGFDPTVPLPEFATPGAAGADLRANLPDDTRKAGVLVRRFARALVPLGFTMAIPHGYEGQIRARSGLAINHGIGVLNSPGTIDSDYRGPVGVIIINLGDADFIVRHGVRIAQLVLAPVGRAGFMEVELCDTTVRGAGGFGSTGIN